MSRSNALSPQASHSKPSTNKNKWWYWVALFLCSGVLVAAMEYVHAPAAFLLGPMIAAIALVVSNHPMSLPAIPFRLAQVMVGLMMASHLPISTFADISAQWPAFIFGTLMTMVASGLVGVVLTKSKLLPGTTAIWGTSPGAAGVMTIMSEHYKADMRLVAVMQYTRVAFCALAAMLTAGLLVDSEVLQNIPHQWSVISWSSFWMTLITALVCLALASRFSVPGGFLLIPMFTGFCLQSLGWLTLDLPESLRVVAFAIMGWGIGFRFSPDVLRHALRVFPYILLSIGFLLLMNALVAWILTLWIDIDFLSAFLGTSPGGADSVAIIAASIPVDTSFVMTMQVSRFLLVMIAGPLLAQWLSRSFMEKSD